MGTEIEDSDDEKFKPGSFGCHEALHMASYFADAVHTELVCHPSIQLNPEWRKLAYRAHDTLVELYQAIAKDHLNNEG